MKFLNYLVLVLSCVFVSCSNDDENGGKGTTQGAMKGVFIVNQGNFYSHIVSSIDFIDVTKDSVCHEAFFKQNGVRPGNTLQAGLVQGNDVYLIAYESNVMFIADKTDLKLKNMVKMTSPRALAADNNYVYVSNYNGYVTRFDTRAYTIKDSVKVGPNPEAMVVANGFLYVTNSDGMNYMGNYANGKSVSKVRLSDFTLEKNIPVGLNPTQAGVDADGNVFIIAMGNYTPENPSTIQKIDPKDNVTNIAEASFMCVGGNTLYAVKINTTDWVNYDMNYFSINTRSGKRTDNILDKTLDYPTCLAVSPTTKRLFVTSCKNVGGTIDYNGPGYVNAYDEKGNFLNSYQTGVCPFGIFFNEQ